MGFVQNQITETESHIKISEQFVAGDSSSAIVDTEGSLAGFHVRWSNRISLTIPKEKYDELVLKDAQERYQRLLSKAPELKQFFEANPDVKEKFLAQEISHFIYTPAD